MKREDFEIMAPVGSYEALQTAINAGANAVYFGLGKLNMRARSSVNFTFDDLPQIMDICKKAKIKAYLTINVVVYDNESETMKEIVNEAKKHQISAIIASDVSVIQYARSVGVEVHISTQVNISNIEAVKFYAAFADVMVLARELNLDQVREISRAIKEENITGPAGKLIRLEMFVHGALCMSISGKCYLSLHHHNYSANRGACLQDCRRGYNVVDKETGLGMDIDHEYIMSPKDLCTINFLNKLVDAGITVLKIEGRARSPEYVKTVVECYNEALDSLVDNTYNEEKIEGWIHRLSTVFNRGFWDGYYLGKKLGEWSHKYGSSATTKKRFIGKITNYFSKLGVAEVTLETGEISVQDGFYIIGSTTGTVEGKVKEMRIDLKPVNQAKKGDVFSMPIGELVRRSDKIYKIEVIENDSLME